MPSSENADGRGWSPEAIARDRTHGSAFLSLRALEILRDRARVLDVTWSELVELALSLVNARPSMTAVANRIHRTMHAAKGEASAAAREAERAIDRARAADASAARRASELVAGRRVFTLSRSGTVTQALVEAEPESVVVAESRPGNETAMVEETLARAGIAVRVVFDAAIGVALAAFEIEIVLVGADTVLPSGAVVNKIGTWMTALAARERNVPVYAVAAEDKVSVEDAIELEPTETPGVTLFELTPPDLVTGIVTENGILAPEQIRSVADKLRSSTDWNRLRFS